MPKNNKSEKNVLVLQGGGALGAYQAGAYTGLEQCACPPDWIAGISIGAINAALIAGNPPERRTERLLAFWEGITARLASEPWLGTVQMRSFFSEVAAASVITGGVPGFFEPRFPPAALMPDGSIAALSHYDTAPLAGTLRELIDFDYLNEKGPRLSVGAVDIETGNFTYFDSTDMPIGPEHIMASGALPPGFPPIEIDGHLYWDGGIVSNTPLQYVLENSGDTPLCIFQIDLFSARGARPADLNEVAEREKDIRYSSRTRLTTDRFRQLHDIGAAADRLYSRLPKELRNDPDAAFLRGIGSSNPVSLVHLIHRSEEYESQSKDYEFSRMSMKEHWVTGKADVEKTLQHKDWKNRKPKAGGIQVFDLATMT